MYAGTQQILEPLMYRIITCADCSRNLFFQFCWNAFHENDVRKWKRYPKSMFRKILWRSKRLSVFFHFFLGCFLKRVLRKSLAYRHSTDGLYGIMSELYCSFRPFYFYDLINVNYIKHRDLCRWIKTQSFRSWNFMKIQLHATTIDDNFNYRIAAFFSQCVTDFWTKK